MTHKRHAIHERERERVEAPSKIAKKIFLWSTFLLGIFCVLVFPTKSFASNVWIQRTVPGTPIINSITNSSDGNTIYLATASSSTSTGYIYISTNNGVSFASSTNNAGIHRWASITSSGDGTKVYAATVCSVSANCGGTADYVYTSTNSGITWNNLTSLGTALDWVSVSTSNDGTKVIAQDNSTHTYVSANSGASWATTTGIGNGNVSVSPDGTMFVATDSSGNVYVSTNNGASWATTTAATVGGAVRFVVATNGNIIYKSGYPYVYKSTNGGASWSALTAVGSTTWANISASSDGSHVVVAGANGIDNFAYLSADGGATWTFYNNGLGWVFAYAQDGTKIAAAAGSAVYVNSPVPTVTTAAASSITATGVTLNATLVYDGGAAVSSTTVEGFNYGLTTTYGSATSTTGTTTPGAWSQTVTGLTCNTVYYFQSYATNINGTGNGTGSYFKTLPCSSNFSIDRSSIPTSATTVINLTGNATGWTAGTPGTPTFSVSGVTGASISSQTVSDATHASLSIVTGTATGTLTITDPSHSTTQTTLVSQATNVIAPDATGIFLTPGSYDSGTYVQWEHTAAGAKFNFTGGILKADLDESLLVNVGRAKASFPYINWRVDGGSWQRTQAYPDSTTTQVMTLATGLSTTTTHSAEVRFEQGSETDTWTPQDAVNLTGWEVQSGSAISAPSPEASTTVSAAGVSLGLRPKRMMIFGDSITRGYNAESSSTAPGQDLTGAGHTFALDSWGPLFAQALDAEVGIVAYSGQGWRHFMTNGGPAFPVSYPMYDSTHSRTMPSNLDYVVVALSVNDSTAYNMANTVSTWLTNVRAAVGASTYIFVAPNLGDVSSTIVNNVDSGVNAYKAANPTDTKVFIIDPGGNFMGTPPGTYWYQGTVHPNNLGHALLASDLATLAVADVPTVISSIASSTTSTSVTITWTTDRAATSLVNYGTTASYTASSTFSGSLTLSHSVTISSLSPLTTYHFQISSIDTASSTATSSDLTFTTPSSVTAPTLLVPTFSGVTQTGATASSTISATGGANATVEGFAWGTNTSYALGTTSSSGSFGISDFSNATTTLTCGTTYHVRAYATNSGGTGYSSDASTTTSPCNATTYTFTGPSNGNAGSASTIFTVTPNGPYNSTITLTPTGGFGLSPTILTFSNSSAPQTFTITPTVAGSITLTPTDNGGLTDASPLTYTANAVVPGQPTSVTAATSTPNQATVTFSAPGFNGGSTILYYLASSTPGNFTGTSSGAPIVVSSLTNGTSYTFAVYAVNAAGTSTPSSASNAVTPIGVPGAPTGAVATAGNTQAVVNFSAPGSTGGSQITGYTVTSSPVGGTDTNAGTTALTHTVTGLANGTPYTFTVTATNVVGTGSASSASSPVTPSTVAAVSTNVVTNIASTSATLSGSITSTGGADANQHGFAYSTDQNLISSVSTTTLGSFTGTGTFTSSVTGLTSNTTYYVRTYSVNASGTTTGSIISFLTLPAVPTMTTQTPTAGSGIFFTANGNITATAVNATARGFVYGTTLAYGATTTSSGSFGTGAYTATITGLTCNTLYHIASYAVNTGGTGYGSDQTITTGVCTKPTLTVQVASGITTTAATLNGSMTADGNASSTVEGFNWGTDTSYGQVASASGTFGIGSFSQSLSSLTCGTTYHFQVYRYQHRRTGDLD